MLKFAIKNTETGRYIDKTQNWVTQVTGTPRLFNTEGQAKNSVTNLALGTYARRYGWYHGVHISKLIIQRRHYNLSGSQEILVPDWQAVVK